jgi:hypothetical protein
MPYRYTYGIERYRYGPRLEVAEDIVVEPLRWQPEGNETGGETPGVSGHGLSAYRWRKCRCPICCAAKAESARRYRQKAQSRGQASPLN